MTKMKRLLEIKLNGERVVLAEVPEEGMLNAFVALWPGVQPDYPTRISAVFRYSDGSEVEKEWKPPSFLDGAELSMKIIESASETPTEPSSTTRLTAEQVKEREKWSKKMEEEAHRIQKEMSIGNAS